MWQMNPQYLMIKKGAYTMDNPQKFVQKTWGTELWFANTKHYCGKLLTVNPKKWSSEGRFHYHEVKDETFFIVQGVLTIDIARENGPAYERITLYENDSYRVMPGVKHRFTSGSEIPCKFIEASTHHEDSDSYRCSYDKKEGDWIYG
jgi:mannose-6-phosphate isomerase-like protein (cupin superfamily)